MWYWVSRVHSNLSYDGLRQRYSITFSKGTMRMLREIHIYISEITIFMMKLIID